MSQPSRTQPACDAEGSPTGLGSASFVGLLSTQFLTSVNDNIFRWLAIGVGKDYVDAAHVGLILMAGTACFVVPYLVLAAPAGYLADRFSKRTVIVACKLAEIVIMGLGVLAIWLGRVELLFAVVALTGAQSALFSPSKLGIIPELLRAESISAANGLFGLSTVAATVIGMGVGNWLCDTTGYRGQESLWISALVVLGVAAAGTAVSLGIRHMPAANPACRFPWNLFSATLADVRALTSSRPLFRVALGVAFFWSVGALAQLNIDQFAAEGGALKETDKVPLLVALVAGLGCGSVLAGIWSAGRVELGILPLGAFGVAVSSICLFTVQGTIIEPTSALTTGFAVALALLFLLGSSAGLFSVPLDSYLQYRSPRRQRGSILAASNLLTFTGVLLSALLYYGLRAPLREGSLERVPPELRGGAAASQPAPTRDRLLADDAASRGDASRQPIESLVAQVTSPQREALLSEWLWREFRARAQQDEFFTKEEYYQRFPDHQPLVKAVYDQAAGLPLLTSQQIFLLAGLCTLPVLVYIVWLIPQAFLRFLAWLASRTVYRVRVQGREHLAHEGGALLVCNHVSWVDGILLALTTSRPIRMIVWAGNFQSPLMRRLADLGGAILVSSRPKQLVAALRTAQQALRDGELVCIFPEGGITRSGQLLAFRPGLMKILEGTAAPVVPVYLDGLWGSIFSFAGGRFFWKWPKRWPYPLSIDFGEPLANPADVHHVRRVVQELGARAVERRTQSSPQLAQMLLRSCRRRRRASKAADSTGLDLTGGQLLARTLVMRRLLRRQLADDEQMVGVLLPPSVGGVVANMALALDRRSSVNLNYTAANEVVNDCLAQARIRHVLTSRRFLEKVPFELNAELIYLEELREQVGSRDKAVAALQAYLLPIGWLARHLRLHTIQGDDLLTVIFTSGSTGIPKGVMLTHANVQHNVEAVEQMIRLTPRDVMIGVLPFFHSFGYSITLWAGMALNVKAAYHFNPLDAKIVGKLCRTHGGTLLVGTPTFLRTYLRRCAKEDFSTVDVVVAGAEKLPRDLSDAFEEKFGVRPTEGYGTTELSPLVSVNIPRSRSTGDFQEELREGSVGRPVPGVAAKVVDLETGRERGAGETGMLLITGPNVMKGYLGREDLTAEVMRDGWYVTGDVALIDDDGFIHITGRESRFSKIGGEMVPHIQIEEELGRVVGIAEEGTVRVAVTAVPDAKKGERLVVLHTQLDQTPEQLCRELAQAGLPNLYIPSADSFFQVEQLPLLGSGKLDLKSIQQMALERVRARQESR